MKHFAAKPEKKIALFWLWESNVHSGIHANVITENASYMLLPEYL